MDDDVEKWRHGQQHFCHSPGCPLHVTSDSPNVRGSGQWACIDGVFYDMTPAPSFRHQDVAGGVYAQLRTKLRGKPCKPYVSLVDVLLLNEGRDDGKARNVVQPGVLIVCDRSKIGDKAMRGAPDWALEVLSPSTSRKDQVKKLDLYERAGVREYWLLHPIERVLTVYTRIDDGHYGRPQVLEAIGTTALSILPEVLIDWAEIFDDEASATEAHGPDA